MKNGEIIRKEPGVGNLLDYVKIYNEFSWEYFRKEIGIDDNRVNIAYEAIDKHAQSWRKNKVALYWEGADGTRKKYTFMEMEKLTNKCANMLRKTGVKKGDRVFIFLPRLPELYISMIAIAKLGAIAGPMFSAFGPDAVRDRLQNSEARVLITTSELKERVDAVLWELPKLEHIVLVNGEKGDEENGEGTLSFETLMENASDRFETEWMKAEDPLYILYTSGTTGKPKGITHVHNDMISHYITTKWVLDLRDDDIYWCTADPGWVTGTVYGAWGPWLNGISLYVFDGRFEAAKWYEIIQNYRISVWYTAPTALRMLMKAGDSLVKEYDLSSLRFIFSVGEPLNPEVIRWGLNVYRLPIHDNWWQTETGSIMIANYPCLPIKPGSMGKPFPGIHAAIIDGKGSELPAGQHGFLALKPGWPSMLRTVWGDEKRFREYFAINGWYATGDTAYKDEDGYFWFVGRADDVINTSGHRVGPFEVESALLEHRAVAESGVIGKPDTERGEIIKAFVVLREGYKPSKEMEEELKIFIKHRLAAHAYPREIEFCTDLPRTRSGKIMRRLLKARDLGLPTGDISTLED
ncbi:MAG: acetate--CoA ligase [Candidatus Loosdrechtia sp.]|uniref:acetate--CoA ligase n=1 Tax=Candidatus Loosdrechtia sp. TaxID=3101272 RepID=UPI003A6A6AFE|nr:MAG: acetate--CoA ligase [Candidatus Jettenia sp. AMX2]